MTTRSAQKVRAAYSGPLLDRSARLGEYRRSPVEPQIGVQAPRVLPRLGVLARSQRIPARSLAYRRLMAGPLDSRSREPDSPRHPRLPHPSLSACLRLVGLTGEHLFGMVQA